VGQAGVELSDRKRLAHLVKSTAQHKVLIDLARTHDWCIGAEVGVLRGKTLFALLDAVPNLLMYAVDQWRHLPLRTDENAETYADFDMTKLRSDVFRKAKTYRRRCTILEGDSVSMANAVTDSWLDFVFIDGDHTEAGVEADVRAWSPKIRPGGMLLGHDCHWTTVRRVIDKLCAGWRDYGEAVWGIPINEVRL
jgi:hypothetical protein